MVNTKPEIEQNILPVFVNDPTSVYVPTDFLAILACCAYLKKPTIVDKIEFRSSLALISQTFIVSKAFICYYDILSKNNTLVFSLACMMLHDLIEAIM